MVTVNRANPFDLSIENQYKNQATPVLYIVSYPREVDDSQNVRFRFANRGDKDYTLSAMTKADADNFHFALVFRPSTLHYNDPAEIRSKFQSALGTQWVVSQPTVQPDSTVVIYFSANVNYPIRQHESVEFLVKGLSGAAATGSRSTQVQLLFREPVGSDFITRVRNQHLDVVNHDGKTFAPLDFVILGDPTLIHRSQDNKLRIQMVQTNGQPIAVNERTFIDFKFPYYNGDYDPNDHPAWVFGSNDKVGKITCEKDAKETTTIATDTTGNDISFGNWGQRNLRARFGKGENMDNLMLKFSNIPADGPIGDARIKITVGNLPGYWDTEFELRVHKTLLSTGYYEPLHRSYGMLNNQVVVGKELPAGWQMDGALHSSLSVTSADINDKNGNSEVTELLRLHDGKIPMNGLGISVGNWQERQDAKDPPKANDPRLKDGFLIKADQYNHGTRFKVDFFGNLWADGRIKDHTGFVMPVGAIIAYGGNAAPEGWLLCDGKTSLNDAKYAELKGKIGLNNTPDLRSRFVVGANPENQKYHLNKTGGEEEHILTVGEMPSHNHNGVIEKTNITNGGNNRETEYKLMHPDTYNRDNVGDMGADYDVYDRKGGDAQKLSWCIHLEHTHNITIGNTGENKAHNNLPPYYALTYIIKY